MSLTDSNLTQTATARPTSTTAGADLALVTGTPIGRFQVVHLLGVGAMGTVYAAHDPELDRRVALKLLHTQLRASFEARERLRQEARTMARLAHRNIVAVYDVGVVAQGVFLAMELVEGTTLQAWCEAESRSWSEVVAAYTAAGHGLEAAHAAGIVHRDFKPDNVLVANDGRIAVSDFGIARVTSSDENAPQLAGDDPRLTQTGALLGTPAYMAPEQLHGRVADARSDQFSFCLSLWRALYDEHAFAGHPKDLEDLRTAFATGVLRGAPAGSKVPGRIHRALVRGLAVDPGQRWPSMRALLRQLAVKHPRRWLAGAAAMVVLAAVTGGIASGLARPSASLPSCDGAVAELATVWSPDRREKLRIAFAATNMAFAAGIYARVATDVDDWTRQWTTQRTAACNAARVYGMQSEAMMDLRIGCLDRRLSELNAVLEVLDQATPKAVENARSAIAALRSPEECSDTEALARAFPPPAPDRAASVAAVGARLLKVEALFHIGDYAKARDAAHEIADAARATGYPPLIAEAEAKAAFADHRLDQYQLAMERYQHALDLAEIAHDDRLRAWISMQIAHSLYMLERYPEAQQYLDRTRAILERIGGNERLRVQVMVQAAEIAAYDHRPDEAIAAVRDAVSAAQPLGPPARPLVMRALEAWAIAAIERARYSESIVMRATSLAIGEEYYGPDHPRVALLVGNLGSAYQHRAQPGDTLRARPLFSRSLEIMKKRLGSDHPALASALNNLAEVDLRLGRLDEAMAGFRRAQVLFEARQGPTSSMLSSPLVGIARIHLQQHQPALAVPLLERAVALDALGVQAADCRFALARALWMSGGDRARARRLAREALATLAPLDDEATHRRDVERWLADPDRFVPSPEPAP